MCHAEEYWISRKPRSYRGFFDEYGEDSDILDGREGFVHAVGFQLAKQEPHDRTYNEELKRQRKHKIFNENGEVASKQRFPRQAVGIVRGRQTVYRHKSHHPNHHKKAIATIMMILLGWLRVMENTIFSLQGRQQTAPAERQS